MTKSKTFWTWLLTAIGAPVAAFGNFDWRVQPTIVGVIVAFAAYWAPPDARSSPRRCAT
ncbi:MULTISPECIES: hypothetical protein [Mesorhizobium]|uniref:hypothetical protein n=1 Tax=Mesorhizobium australicum TaxID=536018 RepID=UPI0033375304